MIIKISILFFLVTSILDASKAESVENLSLKNALHHTLSKNFAIKQSAYSPQEKDALIMKANGDFDWILKLGYKVDRDVTPSSTTLDGVSASAPTLKKDKVITGSLNKKFSWGTQFEMPYTYTINEGNSTFRRFRTSHGPSLLFKVSQPLLESFQPSYFVKSVDSASADFEIAQKEHGIKVIETVLKAYELYWETIKSQETAKIKKYSSDLAKQNFDMIDAKFKLGKVSQIDRLDAESSMRKQEESAESARVSYLNKKQDLALEIFGDASINFELNENVNKAWVLPNFSDAEIISVTEKAIKDRVEYQKGTRSIEKAEAEKKAAQIDKLPDITLSQDATLSGLDADYGKSHNQVIKGDFVSWTTSVKLEYPLMNYAARGSYKSKEIKLTQEQIKRLKVEQDVALELRKFSRQLNTDLIRVSALNKVVEAQKEKYEGQLAKLKQGKLSAYELSRALEDQKNAEIELLEAKISYHIDFAQLSKAQGHLLEAIGLGSKKR